MYDYLSSRTYFHQGYEYEVIRDFLEIQHEIVMSLSTLKRRLKEYGLSRVGNNNIDDNTLRNVIQHEMSGPGDLRGYRAIWHSLRLTHHIHVSRRRIADLLRELNPIASEQRRNRRLTRRRYLSFEPNFCWHVDGEFSNITRIKQKIKLSLPIYIYVTSVK